MGTKTSAKKMLSCCVSCVTSVTGDSMMEGGGTVSRFGSGRGMLYANVGCRRAASGPTSSSSDK